MMKKPQSKFSKTAGKTATRRTPKKNRRGLRKTAGFCGFPAGLATLIVKKTSFFLHIAITNQQSVHANIDITYQFI